MRLNNTIFVTVVPLFTHIKTEYYLFVNGMIKNSDCNFNLFSYAIKSDINLLFALHIITVILFVEIHRNYLIN